MTDITKILTDIQSGEALATDQLLPLVYTELRKLAAAKLAKEKPGQTLQATALVHEAYVRMLGSESDQHWDSRRHFFAAAAEAMRRILVDNARRKQAKKRGGGAVRDSIEPDELPVKDSANPLEVLAIHEALEILEQRSPRKAELVKHRYFLGFTLAESAEILGIAEPTAQDDWAYAKAWLKRQLTRDLSESSFFQK
jgi:RNA polymerase sigma factor (TIGR02999 family)